MKPNVPATGRRYPACRLVLTPMAAIELINRMQQVGSALTQAGIVKQVQSATTPTPSKFGADRNGQYFQIHLARKSLGFGYGSLNQNGTNFRVTKNENEPTGLSAPLPVFAIAKNSVETGQSREACYQTLPCPSKKADSTS